MANKAVATLGGVVFLMAQSKPHQDVSINKLRHLCLAPLDAGMVVLATANTDGAAPDMPVAYAIFASVSESWHEKLKDPKFDISTMPGDAWKSGDKPWLVDLVALKDTAGSFAMHAAGQLFDKGTTLNVRLPDKAGKIKVAEKEIG